MSFFKRLYTFRETPSRSPLEDFLTELLVEWLRQLTFAGKAREVLTGLFKVRSLPPYPETLQDLIWETQHVIGPGHRAANKRPDIVGHCKDFFLIIENKLSAGYTKHVDEEGESNQLSMYDEYRKARPEKFGTVILLTHYTLEPAGWSDRVCNWREIHRYLKAMQSSPHNACKDTALNYVSEKFLAFIGEYDMNGTRLDLNDVVAITPYKRLLVGMRRLGAIATRAFSLKMQDTTARCSVENMRVPHPNGMAKFAEPNFFGSILTPNGKKTDDSMFIIWAGVIGDEVYDHIKPEILGLPELSVGFGVWIPDPMLNEKLMCALDQLVLLFNEENVSRTWQWSYEPIDHEYTVVKVCTQRSLTDVHNQARGGDWDDIAAEFFRMNLDVMFNGFSISAAGTEKSFFSALRASAGT
ncbi:hypothetical protein ACTJKT_16320 [Pseudomonas sp. 22526]|uniref:hypothetical protein n=1 Tax=Pseudomonas sp. 22526 TaxID=3453937 RepID=UPI003F836E19